MKLHRFALPAALAAILTLAGCSLAADVTPPPDYRPTEVVQPVALETAYPLVPPDPASGAPIYAEKCLPCHGQAGLGDGPQASKLPSPPPSIGTFDLASTRRPADWYALVTQGNFEKMMPGFSGSLSDRQRWDVVAYAYSLSMPKEQLDQGKAVYERLCAECHGESGKGDGPKAPASIHDWTQPPALAQLSALEILDLTMKGSGEMPGFNSQLSAAESWAVVQYARWLTFGSAQSPSVAAQSPNAPAESGTPSTGSTPPAGETPAPSGTEQADSSLATVAGTIVNASGGTVPAGLKVELLGYDQMQQALKLEADARPDGAFVFPEVEVKAGRAFMATVKVNDQTFNSDVLHATDLTGGGARITLNIYDSSTDASQLVADRMHVFFDFSQPGKVQVGELFIISNPTNKMIMPAAADQPILKFQVPAGASNLSFQDGEMGGRFVQTENGFGDLLPVQPGSGVHQVLFAYDLPYDRKVDVSLTAPVPVSAVVVIAPATGVKLRSAQLQDMGVRDMQNVQVHLYSADGLAPGGKLDVSLSAAMAGGLFESNNLVGILGGSAVLLLAVGVAAWWYLRRRSALVPVAVEGDAPAQQTETIDGLLDAIVALDDLYQAGDLPKEAYDERRAELKDRLRRAHEAGGNGGGPA